MTAATRTKGFMSILTANATVQRPRASLAARRTDVSRSAATACWTSLPLTLNAPYRKVSEPLNICAWIR